MLGYKEGFSIAILLNEKFEKKMCYDILYYFYENDAIFYDEESWNIVPYDEAKKKVELIFEPDYDEPRSFLIRLIDTDLYVLFLEYKNNIEFSISPADIYHRIWVKKISHLDNDFDYDIPRYIRLAIDACQGFEIKKIHFEYSE